MRIIKKETDYAIRALYFIHSRGGMASSADIYSEMNMPRPFIRKILQMLAREEILISFKGRGGGFKLSIPFEKLDIATIDLIFSEPMKKGNCPFRNPLCSNYNRCKLKFKIYELENKFYDELKKIKLIDLWR